MGSHPKQADIAIRPAINPPVQVKALDDDAAASGRKRKPTTAKRRKVNHACLYCRRSHMTCDEGRPCQRWSAPTFSSPLLVLTHESLSSTSIKREIAHLCHDEQKPPVVVKDKAPSTTASTSTSTPTPAPDSESQAQPKPAMSAPEQPMNTFPCE